MLLLFLTLTAAAQSDEAREAEHVRLSETMRRLAGRNAWEGVDRSYRQLDGLALDLTYDDHYIAAQAAWALGDAGSTQLRLERALTIKADEGVQQWLGEIHHSYTAVQLSGSAVLTIAEVPFAADQRAALAYAEALLAEDSLFIGMLPNGRYTFGAHVFELLPGSPTVIIGKSPGRTRRGELSVGPILPAASLGIALTRAGAPAGIVLQPAAFSGPGLRLGLGPEVSLGGALGAKAEVGYHGLLTADSQLHLGYAWLAATWSIVEDGLVLSAGPEVSMGRAKTLGLERTVYEDYCTVRPDDLHCGWVDLAALDDMALAAWVRTAGFTAGVSRHVRTMGGVRSGVSLLGGLQTDSHRWYPWAELALTFHGGGDL